MFGFGQKSRAIEAVNSGAKIVDVRSPGEFSMGHVEGSINIPLDQISTRVNDVKKLGEPVVVCCASGMRSGQAMRFLSDQGIEVLNAGSWKALN